METIYYEPTVMWRLIRSSDGVRMWATIFRTAEEIYLIRHVNGKLQDATPCRSLDVAIAQACAMRGSFIAEGWHDNDID